jgi:excisionase family DNA binding protein
MPGVFLTVREAARRLKVSTATVYKACARGEISCVRVLNVLRIPAGELAGRPGAS